jgi:hypothetical protein
MKKILISTLLVGLAALNIRCTSSDVGIDKSLRFPKLEKGRYWVYKVSENLISNGKATNSEYTLREQIKDTISLGKQLMYFVDVFKKTNGEFDFVKTGSKLYYETDFGFYEKEGSNTTLRLKYPVYLNHEWYYSINQGEQQDNLVKYTQTRKEIVLYDKKKFDNAFQLQVRNDSTGLFRRKNYEVYHPNYGLVFSELISEDYCQETPACIGKGIVVNSKVVFKTLIDTN